MSTITRRSFLKTGAAAAAGTIAVPALLSKGWYAFAQAEAAGYFEREFGITEKMCRDVLAQALAKGGDFADLYFEHTISNYLILEDGKVNRAASEVALGVGIRTVKGDQVGYGFTQDLDEKAMLAAASTAATIADASGKEPRGTFVSLKTKNYYPMTTLFSSVPLETKLPLVQSVNDKCFALSASVAKVSVVFHDQQKRILVVTSDGTQAEDLQPLGFLAASVVAEKDGRREQSGWNYGGRREFSYYTPALAEKLARRPVSGELFWDPDRERMLSRVRQTAKPCLIFKVYAAGRHCGSPEQMLAALRLASSYAKPSDCFVIGMYPKNKEQVRENCRLVAEALRSPATAVSRF